MLTSLAIALLLMVLVVRLWPLTQSSPDEPGRTRHGNELIQIEEIRATRQRQNVPPPPPPPLPPVVRPDDEILDPLELELAEEFLEIQQPETAGAAGESDDEAVKVAEGPRPVRFVEPEYTREAQRRRIRAEVVVAVFVDEQGRVQDVRVLERYLLGKDDDPRELVGSIGYGLEEAATSAAERWIFRPARRNGQPVSSETTITFRFGV